MRFVDPVRAAENLGIGFEVVGDEDQVAKRVISNGDVVESSTPAASMLIGRAFFERYNFKMPDRCDRWRRRLLREQVGGQQSPDDRQDCLLPVRSPHGASIG